MPDVNSPRLRRLLLVVSALGALLFAGLAALSFIEPLWIERAVREVLRHEVRRIESAYGEVSRHLLRELRIFAGVNALAFGLLALITLNRRASTLQLLLPSVAVIGAAALTASVYLFNQDWLHTIVFGQYVGWAYAAWYGVALAWMADLLATAAGSPRTC